MFEIAARFPRLFRIMRAAGFTEGETASAIHARLIKDDFAAAEAICFVGGAAEAIRFARKSARMRRVYMGRA